LVAVLVAMALMLLFRSREDHCPMNGQVAVFDGGKWRCVEASK
jgi:hypothetical protein